MKKISLNTVDFRSDTVTKPDQNMLQSISLEGLGDDVYSEDQTTLRLEKMSANLCGFEFALFVPSGTCGNLISLLTHCKRGEQYLTGDSSHIFLYEQGGGSMFGSITPRPFHLKKDGTTDFKSLQNLIYPDDIHFAKTSLLCLESTYNGHPLPRNYLLEAINFCKKNQLKLHMDGARIFNATEYYNTSPKDYLSGIDSISFCLSKGLGAPIGSILCGNKNFIEEARRYRKALGAGMRQTGVLAYPGIYALENNIPRLKKDHELTHYFASKLMSFKELKIDLESVKTNMFFIHASEESLIPLSEKLKNHNILITKDNPIRIVVHKDISKEDIDRTINIFKEHFSGFP